MLFAKLCKNIKKNKTLSWSILIYIKLVDNSSIRKELFNFYSKESRLYKNDNIKEIRTFMLAPMVICYVYKSDKSNYYNNVELILNNINTKFSNLYRNTKIMYNSLEKNIKIKSRIASKSDNIKEYRNNIITTAVCISANVLKSLSTVVVISKDSIKNIKIADRYISRYLECAVNQYSLNKEELEYKHFYKWKKISICKLLDNINNKNKDYILVNEYYSLV